jgi:hypothetical protein
VRVHLAEGNVAEAVRVYEGFEAMLADELGAAPTEQMCRLVAGLPTRRTAMPLARLDRPSADAFLRPVR